LSHGEAITAARHHKEQRERRREKCVLVSPSCSPVLTTATNYLNLTGDQKEEVLGIVASYSIRIGGKDKKWV
jgi:hypothetical protein